MGVCLSTSWVAVPQGVPGAARRMHAQSSVIIGAAEVVAAVGADQFAVVAGEAMAAGGADLAVVIDPRIGTGVGGPRVIRVNSGAGAGEVRVRAGHTTL